MQHVKLYIDFDICYRDLVHFGRDHLIFMGAGGGGRLLTIPEQRNPTTKL